MSKMGQSLIDKFDEEDDSNEPDYVPKADEDSLTPVDNAMVDLDRSMGVLNNNRDELHHYANELKAYAKRLVDLAAIANRKLF
jgi:hypothetical protein